MAPKLDLLLVNVGGSKKKVYQDLSRDYSAIEPPFWAALTAGFARQRGYETKILDAYAENLSIEESIERVEDYNPRLVNIVVYGQQPAASTQLMGPVGELCKQIKQKNPQRKILLTGLHPSALPRKTLEEEACDYVGEGEGFYSVLGLLKNKDLTEIPGLWWKDEELIRNNSRANNIQNLTEELGEVAWDLLPMNKYKAHNWQCLGNFESRKKYASISTSLGCPHRCNFCSISASFGGEHRIRNWSPEWVVNQLDTLQNKYGVEVIKIIDEMFIINPSHYLGICNGITEKDLKLNIWSYARVDTTRERDLEKLKKAGFDWLCFGFEAGNDEIRKNAQKGRFIKQDMRRIKNVVETNGINIIGNYMFGFPEDTESTMRETLDFAKELNCEFANFYCAMAYPGSQLFLDSVKKGIKLPDSWIGYSQHSYECKPLQTNFLDSSEVLRFRDRAFEEYFSNPYYLNMIEKKFGIESREHIGAMIKTKMKRKILGD